MLSKCLESHLLYEKIEESGFVEQQTNISFFNRVRLEPTLRVNDITITIKAERSQLDH